MPEPTYGRHPRAALAAALAMLAVAATLVREAVGAAGWVPSLL